MGSVQISQTSSEIDNPNEDDEDLVSSLDSIEVSDTSSVEDAESILTESMDKKILADI